MGGEDLVQEALQRKGNDYFFIDTAGEVGRWGINILPSHISLDELTPKQAYYACANHTLWKSHLNNYTGINDIGWKWWVTIDAVTNPNYKIFKVDQSGEDELGFHCSVELVDGTLSIMVDSANLESGRYEINSWAHILFPPLTKLETVYGSF